MEESAIGRVSAEGAPSPLPEGWQQQWPAFRGPNGDGICAFADIPQAWDETAGTGILWKVAVPLPGLSSPVVWNGRIYLSGATRERRALFCYKAENGELVWQRECPADTAAGNDYPAYDLTGIHAAPTPVVDGQRVTALFANGQVLSCDAVTGDVRWTKFLGVPENSYGIANSLLRWRGNVLIRFDSDPARLLALDAATGAQMWDRRIQESGWCSPILAQTAPGAWQVIVQGSPDLAAYDPDDGRSLWYTELCSGDVAPTPVFARGLVLAAFQGNGLFAVKPDGKGDVSADKIAWRVTELESGMFPDCVGPVSDGERVYFFSNVLVCTDLASGKVLYEQTLKDASGNDDETAYASPCFAGGRLMFFGKRTTYLVEPGPTCQVVGRCPMNEGLNASPAFAPGRIFLRGPQHLYAIGH